MKPEGFPKHVKLRNGNEVDLVLLTPNDGPELLEFFRSLPEADRLYLREDVTQGEFIERFVHSIDYDSMVPIVARVGGSLVGNATLYRPAHGWSRHVGQIRMAVKREYQRSGLGTAMARALVKHATSSGLDKLVAEVMENQIGALRAFEKLGFKAEATLKGQVKDIHGKKKDLVIMANDVGHIWERMEALVADYSPMHGE